MGNYLQYEAQRYRPFESIPVLNRDSLQAQGLVGFWPLLTPYGGIDLVRGNTATPSNTPTRILTEVGWVYDFNEGEPDSFAATSLPVTLIPLTMAAWVVYRTSEVGDRHAAFSLGDSAGGSECQTVINRNGGLRYISQSGPALNSDGGTSLVAGRTYLVSMTVSATHGMEGYLDGISEATGGGGDANFDTFYIGQRHGTGTNQHPHDGQIWDVRVWNRRLTPDEHFALFDEATRWDLYWQPKIMVSVPAGVAAAAILGHGRLLSDERNQAVI